MHTILKGDMFDMNLMLVLRMELYSLMLKLDMNVWKKNLYKVVSVLMLGLGSSHLHGVRINY